MSTIYLIHGGFHGGWCWEQLIPLLEAAGHRVVAPDLPGMGEDPTPLGEVTLALCADSVAARIAAEPEPVLLVGHSMGGITISEVAERVPDRLLGLVYLAARLIPGGQSMADGFKAAHPAGPVLSADGLSISYDPAHVADTFYNTTPADVVATILPRMGPQPIAPTRTPQTTTAERYGRVPRAYIECTEDHSNPLPSQRAMQAALPCDPVVTMPTDHSPFYSAPEQLAEHLTGIAEAFTASRNRRSPAAPARS